MAEKDIIEKKLESYDEVFADIVNGLLFQGEQLVKPEELSNAQPHAYYKAAGNIRELERDIAKNWKRINLCLAFYGLENETEQEDDFPLRVVGYDGAEYRNQLRYEKDADGKRRLVPGPRYPIVTLGLYFGLSHWTKPRNLLDCLDIPEELRPYVSDYHVNIFEIAWLTDEELSRFHSDFRIVAEYFVQLRKNGNYVPTPQEMTHVREVLDLLSVLTKDRRFVAAYDLWDDEEEPHNMSEVLDRMIHEGWEDGRKKGWEDGRKKGNEEGREEGRILTLYELVRKGILSMADAAEGVGLTVDGFVDRANALGLSF